MSDAIQYCKNCETNVMCHMERKCMRQANGLSSAADSRCPSSSAYLKRLREFQNKSENCSIVFSENK